MKKRLNLERRGSTVCGNAKRLKANEKKKKKKKAGGGVGNAMSWCQLSLDIKNRKEGIRSMN